MNAGTFKARLLIKSQVESKRYIKFVISTQDRDTVDDIVLSKGCRLDMYRKNPVIFIEHGITNPVPVGKAADEKGNLDVQIYGDRIESGCYYSDTDYGLSAHRLTQEGILRGASVSADPRTAKVERNAYGGRTWVEWQMREWSLTGRPVNYNCWAKSFLASGLATKRLLLKSMTGLIIMGTKTRFNMKVVALSFLKSKFADTPAVDAWLTKAGYTNVLERSEDKDVFKVIFDKAAKATEKEDVEDGVSADTAEEEDREDKSDMPGAKFCKSLLDGLHKLHGDHSEMIKSVEHTPVIDHWGEVKSAIEAAHVSTAELAKSEYNMYADSPFENKDQKSAYALSLLHKAALAIQELVSPTRTMFRADKERYLKLVKSLNACREDGPQSAELAALEAETKEKYFRLTGQRL